MYLIAKKREKRYLRDVNGFTTQVERALKFETFGLAWLFFTKNNFDFNDLEIIKENDHLIEILEIEFDGVYFDLVEHPTTLWVSNLDIISIAEDVLARATSDTPDWVDIVITHLEWVEL